MKTCNNCGTTITCGCQERVASNGKQVCGACITAYEQSLIIANATTQAPTINENFTSQ